MTCSTVSSGLENIAWLLWNRNYNGWLDGGIDRGGCLILRLSTWRWRQVWIIHIPVTVIILFPRVICTSRWHVHMTVIVRMNWTIPSASSGGCGGTIPVFTGGSTVVLLMAPLVSVEKAMIFHLLTWNSL